MNLDDIAHADYPHEPGGLYDCARCEAECFCTGEPGHTECVFCALLREAMPPGDHPSDARLGPVRVRRDAAYLAIRAEVNMHFGDGDPYGTAMEWWFAIADQVWHWMPEAIPADWQFGHSPLCEGLDDSYSDSMIRDMLKRGDTNIRALRDYGVILTRYMGWLKRAGLNY